MCPPMRAQWCHLANTIELVHPSAHSSQQPEQQIDRFSPFCTDHGRKCLYFTMGALIHQNCPFPWEDLDPLSNAIPWTHANPFKPNGRFCTNDCRVSLYFKWFAHSPSKLPLPMGRSGPHVIHSSLGPPESSTQMVTWSLEPFLQGSLVWLTDRQWYSVGNNGTYVRT